jgi:asparagine synthase (glutamine-hydrolysing)
MCGICGSFSANGLGPNDERTVRSMMELLEHRGPDGEGLWKSESGAVLGHRRLAIIDLLGGYQPQFNETGDVAVIVNGEIYNYLELRRELTSFGHVFRTVSDTEVLVHGYEQWGDEVVTHLRGMFAFAIWDEQRRRMILGRDRFGVKPLYYIEPEAGHLLFASEIKALFVDSTIKRRLNADRLAEYLMFRSVAGDETLFEGVKEIPPGSLLVLEGSKRRMQQYWSPEVEQGPKRSLEDLVEEGRELLRDAIDARLVSDVLLGTITSGGLDSSLVSAVAAELTKGPIDTFCVGFADSAYDERPFARLVSDQIQSRHHEIVVSPTEINNELERLTWAHDEPLTHPNSVPMHLIFRDAKERADVTVLLSGEGADEVFGGYAWYRAAQQRDTLQRSVPGITKLAKIAPAVSKLGTLKKVLSDDYLATANAFSPGLLVNDLLSRANGVTDSRKRFLSRKQTGADGVFIYDQQTYLLPLLQRQDRMSMAAGLEAREPFLDHKLVEWANGLSAEIKLAGGVRKALLKSIATRWLPSEIVHRKKVGFEMPLGAWLRKGGTLADRVQALRDSGSFASQLTTRTTVERLISEHDAGSANHADILWTLIALDVWGDTFLGGRVKSERLPGAATGKDLPTVAASGVK